MYSSFPKQDRIRIKLALALAWSFVMFGGLAGIVTAKSVEAELGFWIPFAGSFIVSIFGAVAVLGIVLNRYWLEWVAAWFVSGGVFVYALYIWYITIASGSFKFQGAALLTALLFFFAYRIVACSAHARKQRLIHKLVQTNETEIHDA